MIYFHTDGFQVLDSAAVLGSNRSTQSSRVAPASFPLLIAFSAMHGEMLLMNDKPGHP